MRFLRVLVGLSMATLLIPAVVRAQAITGTVQDTSGAVLPGVSVEAASPELIEKVRTGVTDGAGLYRIEGLRPGTYTVTFTLSGFSTVKREGIQLTGSFIATVNADLKVGTLQETIVVTGETPIVDVQSAKRQTVVSKDLIDGLPTTGGYSSLLALVPGIVGGTRDVQTGPCACTFSSHGALLAGRANEEGRTLLDGLLISVPQGSSSNYPADTRNATELSFTVAGSLGETETGGPVLNIVPKTGGNRVSSSLFAGVGPQWLEGSNYTQTLKDAGLTAATPLTKNYDYSGALGGPIRQDRLWFFLSGRTQGNTQYVSNIYSNRNAGNPNAWLYDPDTSRQAFRDRTWENAGIRLTAQISPRNKLNIFWDETRTCRTCENSGNNASVGSPEANSRGEQPIQVKQAAWTSTISNKVLIEAGIGEYQAHWGGFIQKQDPYTGNLVRMIEQCTAGCPANGNIPGLIYRSQSNDLFVSGQNLNFILNWRFNVSYVTGAHSFKAGYASNLLGDLRSANKAPNNLDYRVNNGVPNQITMYINNFQNDLWMRGDGYFAQEQWTHKRLTLQGSVRLDHAISWAPEQTEGPVRFVPTPISFPRTPIVDSYNDLTPRVAAAYDLFGNGKTAVKTTFGKYLEAAFTGRNYASANPTSRIIQNVARSWTDANSNFQPDCDLLNPNAQDFRTAGGDFCGAYANRNFGTTTFSNTIDPSILSGWGVRPSDWNLGVSVQHEVLPRTSLEVGYFWRWFRGFLVTDNLATGPADFDKFTVTAPLDPRLPNGGGYAVTDLYNVTPTLFGITNNYVTYSDKYGDQYAKFNGLDINLNARPFQGLVIQGGFNGGRTVSDNCEIRAKLPEISPLNPYCHVESGYLPHYKLFGSYMVPKVDVQVGVTFTSKPGLQVSFAGTPTAGGHLSANYTVANSAIVQSLGRSLAGGAANATVNMIPPGSLYGDRINEVDLRLAKLLKFGRWRANLSADVYNLFNTAPILSYNEAFIPNGAWLLPTSVMTARFAKLNVQFDF
ncbi:MAG: carboxypeptidase-like regulatory domain-containing protein [Acidobacteriota bacterium]